MSIDVGHLLFHFGLVVFEIFTGVLAALLIHGALTKRKH